MRPGISTVGLSVAVAAASMLQGGSAFGAERNLFVDVAPSVAAAEARAASQLDRIKKRATVKEVRVVRVETTFLSDSKEAIRLNVFEGSAFPVVLRRIERRSDKDYSWIGTVTGTTPGTATFVVRDGRITGTIRPGNEIYMVEPLESGLHAIIKVDPTKFPPDHPPKQESGGQAEPDAGGAVSETKSAMTTAEGVAADEAPTRIDVIVAYTPAARAQHSDMAGLIQTAVDEANTSYADSGVHLRLRLVNRYETQYTESGSFDTDLTRFRSTGDAHMREIHTRRSQYNADVAVLIIDNSSACGLASTINATAAQAFAAVHWDCATGYFSFAHEIGHLQGARHDPAADPSTSPFVYGHGFLNTGGGWRTIMAYNSASCSGGSCTRVQCWSTPSRNYPCAQNPSNGVAMGTAATHDNVRVLDSTRGRVAGFLPVKPPKPRKCKSGEKCCEPVKDGCLLCISKNKHCP